MAVDSIDGTVGLILAVPFFVIARSAVARLRSTGFFPQVASPGSTDGGSHARVVVRDKPSRGLRDDDDASDLDSGVGVFGNAPVVTKRGAEAMSEGLRSAGKRRSVGLIIATLLLGGSLAACGEDEPAVCGSVDNLKSSVDDVKDVDVSSSAALSDLQSGLSSVESDLADVKADAKSEFSSQIQAVEQSLAALKTSAKAAAAEPTAATLSAARAALSTFGTGVETLVSDIQSTC